jgi:NAD(P)-dependent dehydrogenase (short-subunit alcohol dehydrogenase family)
MNNSLKDRTVVVVGRGGGIARAVVLAARDAGAQVIAIGRDQDRLADAYEREPGVSTEVVDLTDEASIAALAKRVETVDHVVSTASARARGQIGDLDRDAVRLAIDTKVRRIGTTEDIASGVLFAMTNTFLTGQTLHIDGGEPLT